MEKCKIIIIGAGAAGIAAATRLLKHGMKDFIILEAEGRIGGRICSKNFGDGIVDLGAQWVHGETSNVVYSMVEPLDLLDHTVTEIMEAKTMYVTASGKVLDSEKALKFMSIFNTINSEGDFKLRTYNKSLGDYFTEELKNYETDIPKEDRHLSNIFLSWYQKFQESIDGSDNWFDTSGKGSLHYHKCEGNQFWRWKSGGYATILRVLMGKYSTHKMDYGLDNKLLFNKEVVSIEWEKDNSVEVGCSDGSKYCGEYALVTMSLGVLKEKANTIFSPPLPQEKLKAIKGLGIGTVDKIFLKFPHQWWPKGCHGFNFLWTKEELEDLRKTGKAPRWISGIFGFYVVDEQPNVLCGWICGKEAHEMELLSNQEVMDACQILFEIFLSKKLNIPKPDGILRSTWYSNHHFRGSYSHRSMDSDRLNVCAAQLAAPVKDKFNRPIILFAGEATHNRYFSTVHGAIETGWREASRLLDLCRLRSSL